MEQEKKEFIKWWILLLLLLFITTIILFATGTIGKYFNTTVERKIFEQSYQKKEGDSKRIQSYKAQLASINVKLNGNISNELRNELESQKAMLEIQLKSK